jgi:hypothetical protein
MRPRPYQRSALVAYPLKPPCPFLLSRPNRPVASFDDLIWPKGTGCAPIAFPQRPGGDIFTPPRAALHREAKKSPLGRPPLRFGRKRCGSIVHGKDFAAGYGDEGYRAHVRTSIKRIRKKLHDVEPEFEHILNYAGFGYRWTGD